MPKFHMVVESEKNLTQEELDAGKKPRIAFQPTAGDAKRLARDWNGGKLTASAGVQVRSELVLGGKAGMLTFLNGLVGYKDPNAAVAKGKAAPSKKAVKKSGKK